MAYSSYNFFYTQGLPNFKTLVNPYCCRLSLSQHLKSVDATQGDMRAWKASLDPLCSAPPASWSTWKCPSCLLPLIHTSTKTKQRKKTKCHTGGGRPLQQGVRAVCVFGRAAGGRLGQMGRKDQSQRNTRTHTHTLLVCIFSHNGQQHRDIIWLPSCRERKRQEFVALPLCARDHYNIFYSALVQRKEVKLKLWMRPKKLVSFMSIDDWQ